MRKKSPHSGSLNDPNRASEDQVEMFEDFEIDEVSGTAKAFGGDKRKRGWAYGLAYENLLNPAGTSAANPVDWPWDQDVPVRGTANKKG